MCRNVKRSNNNVISRFNEREQNLTAGCECRHTPAHEPGPKQAATRHYNSKYTRDKWMLSPAFIVPELQD